MLGTKGYCSRALKILCGFHCIHAIPCQHRTCTITNNSTTTLSCASKYFEDCSWFAHSFICQEQAKSFVASCPTSVYRYRDDTNEIDIEDAQRCMFCNECVKVAATLPVEDLVTLHQDTDCAYFTVEGTGALPVADILQQALAILLTKTRTIDPKFASSA